jgi:short-subunit dehydrogenase
MAVQLARRGARLALTGRREDKLEETAKAVEAAGGEALRLAGSVVDLGVVKGHYAAVKAKWGGLDWAILNAGVGDSMSAKQFDAETYRWTFATNVGGVANWLEAVLPDMIAQGSGVVAGVSSLAAFRGLPDSGPYCASKAALITLLESTRVDLRGTGVDVVTVCPGFVKSEMTDRNDAKEMPFLMDVEDGAACLLRGIEARRRVVHFPWPLSYPMKYVVARLPGLLYDWLITRFPRKKKKPARRD